jgi:hypothetical protein
VVRHSEYRLASAHHVADSLSVHAIGCRPGPKGQGDSEVDNGFCKIRRRLFSRCVIILASI